MTKFCIRKKKTTKWSQKYPRTKNPETFASLNQLCIRKEKEEVRKATIELRIHTRNGSIRIGRSD